MLASLLFVLISVTKHEAFSRTGEQMASSRIFTYSESVTFEPVTWKLAQFVKAVSIKSTFFFKLQCIVGKNGFKQVEKRLAGGG